MKKFFLIIFFLIQSPFAFASLHGCTVLLCLLNPNGWSSVGECVDPIKKLFHDLKKLRPFPSCDSSDGNDGSSYVKPITSHYDSCPTGTTALGFGQYAVKKKYDNNFGFFIPDANYTIGIGSGDGLEPGGWILGERHRQLPDKTCVGKKLSETTVQTGSGRYYKTNTAGVYDKIEFLSPQGGNTVLDVFLEGNFDKRVRY